jgi:hypothetical protein
VAVARGASELDEVVPGECVVGLVGRVDDHEVLDRAGGKRVGPAGDVVVGLEDHHLGRGVLGDVRHLAAGQGVVDRHRGRAGVHRADVGEHVLEPVGTHDRDAVTRLHAQLDEGSREREALVAELAPAEGSPARTFDPDLVGEGRLVALLGDQVGEGVRDGAAQDLGLDLLAVGEYVGHGFLHTLVVSRRSLTLAPQPPKVAG